MIVSSLAEEGAEQTVAALALGAADTLAQARHRPLQRPLFRSPARQAQGARPRDRSAPLPPRAIDRAARRARFARCRPTRSTCLPIGASTGGHPCARRRCFARFRARSAFRSSSPSICRRRSCRCSRASSAMVARREALVAEDGMALAPDRIIIAPGDAHLTLEPDGNGADRPPDRAAAAAAAACPRSIRCWRRSARSTAPRRSA